MDISTHLGIHDHTDELNPKNLRLRSACAEGETEGKNGVTFETVPLSAISGNATAKTAKKTGFANDCDLPIISETAIGPRGGMADTGDLKSPGE